MTKLHTLILCLYCIICIPTLAHSFVVSTNPSKLEKESGTTIAPHKALYDIRLKKINSDGRLINIEGEMYFSLATTCTGWITDHRFTLFYDYNDTPRLKMTSVISTYESYDGQDFQFLSTRKKNGNIYEEINGHLLTKKTNKDLMTVEYSKPQTNNLSMSPNTLLPIQHTAQLLKAAQQGKKYITLSLFDGSDDQGPMEVSAFISPAINSLHHTRPEEDLYKIELAFFQQNSKSELAEYEIMLYIHNSGIIPYMLIDYGSFTISQSLRSIEDLPQENCGIKEQTKRVH
ncbi:MAG: DUF1849 family protein [Alphaproteobacteria bacterium]|nr:DUF1849 family protein [Alphaproteobacteria bacterium]